MSVKSYRTGEVIFKQGDIMDAVYIVTKGSVRLDVGASSDAFSFIRDTLRQQFGSMGTDELNAMFSASSLDAAAAALIKRFVPVTQTTQHRSVRSTLSSAAKMPSSSPKCMAAPALRAVSSLTDDQQTNVLGSTLGVGFGLSPKLYSSISNDFSCGFYQVDMPWVRHHTLCFPSSSSMRQVPPALPPLGSEGLRFNITRSLRGAHAFASIRGAQRFCSVVGPRSFVGVDTCRADALLMHELLGSREVMEWLHWTGSQQALLHSSALGKLLQASCLVAKNIGSTSQTSIVTLLQESAPVLLKLNVPVYLSGAVATDSANVIRIARSSLDRMDMRK